MRKLAMLAVAVMALAAPVASHAQVTLGLRLGFAPAMGDASDGSDMSDMIKSQIPLQLDVMYKVMPNLSVGGYFGYGFGQNGDFTKAICDGEGVDCSTSVKRLGVQAAYSFAPMDGFTPWAGAGLGYEWGTVAAEMGGVSADVSFSGFEFLNLNVGGDFKVNEQFGVGPFLGITFAQYSNAEFLGEEGDIEEKGIHNWLQFGVRGTFDL
jgi:outer membrane protein W